MASEKSALPGIHEVDKKRPEKANRHRERSRKGRRESAVKSAGEERIAFIEAVNSYEVNLSKETRRKAARKRK